MNVAAWLHGLELGQYEQAFRENDIDAEVLAHLTASDLIGVGVTSVGHRRKLLAAIVALRNATARRLTTTSRGNAREPTSCAAISTSRLEGSSSACRSMSGRSITREERIRQRCRRVRLAVWAMPNTRAVGWPLPIGT
ncbi:SAM domain-containing protein [Bradyrhizobium sp. CCGB12]|uniref:SAM domain-containing protein n=1 Tax=Bradyrhizobium sp. CCGB12 TaxID=2949632 RepID=UPI0020B3A664|nr:SAM domain-containing protein [Bradyrhizobium sp. CCGB12]MCP3395342.1 SAM domain-containing protein [Bradyrhizobium sp. CCGB12]